MIPQPAQTVPTITPFDVKQRQESDYPVVTGWVTRYAANGDRIIDHYHYEDVPCRRCP